MYTLVLSGPAAGRPPAASALARAGFTVGPETHSHGLPSYRDPLVAHDAGKPNSGHTPGTGHPAQLDHHAGYDDEGTALYEPQAHECEHVGAAYENDPTVAWITAEGPEGRVDAAVEAVDRLGWQLRAHGVRGPDPEPDALEDALRRLKVVEAKLAEREAIERSRA